MIKMLIKFSRLKIQYVVYYNIVTDRRKFYENDKRHIFKNHKIYIKNSKAVFGEGYMKSSFWKKLDTYIDELCRETISGCSCLILQNGI